VAVLPFANLNNDPEQEYFTDGIVEDIITGAVAIEIAIRNLAKFELHLQGKSRRHQAGHPRAWRSLCAGSSVRRPENGFV